MAGDSNLPERQNLDGGISVYVLRNVEQMWDVMVSFEPMTGIPGSKYTAQCAPLFADAKMVIALVSPPRNEPLGMHIELMPEENNEITWGWYMTDRRQNCPHVILLPVTYSSEPVHFKRDDGRAEMAYRDSLYEDSLKKMKAERGRGNGTRHRSASCSVLNLIH